MIAKKPKVEEKPNVSGKYRRQPWQRTKEFKSDRGYDLPHEQPYERSRMDAGPVNYPDAGDMI